MFATKPYPDTSFYNIHTITTGPQREIFPTTRPTRTSREFLTREYKFFTVSFGHLNVDSSLHIGEFHRIAGISYIKSRAFSVYSSGSQPMCKWSNENCNDGSECCSHNCEQAHVGTSARCLRSSLNEPCHADFHCDEYLKCGRQFRCCSPFWGVCTKRSDCCEPEHVCRSEKGFYYRLCLNPARSSGISLNELARYHAMMMCLVFYLW